MQYKFMMPDGQVQITDTGNQQLIDYIDTCLLAHPLDQDEAGNYLVTDPDLFNQLMTGAE